MVNPAALMKLLGFKRRFESNHPKFSAMVQSLASRPIEEGTVLEIAVVKPDGTRTEGNMRVQASDLEMIRELKELSSEIKPNG